MRLLLSRESLNFSCQKISRMPRRNFSRKYPIILRMKRVDRWWRSLSTFRIQISLGSHLSRLSTVIQVDWFGLSQQHKQQQQQVRKSWIYWVDRFPWLRMFLRRFCLRLFWRRRKIKQSVTCECWKESNYPCKLEIRLQLWGQLLQEKAVSYLQFSVKWFIWKARFQFKVRWHISHNR